MIKAHLLQIFQYNFIFTFDWNKDKRSYNVWGPNKNFKLLLINVLINFVRSIARMCPHVIFLLMFWGYLSCESTADLTTLQSTLMTENPSSSADQTEATPSTDGPRFADEWWTTEPTSTTDDRIPLYLAGLFSLDGIWDGSGVFIGADLALKHVNEDPSILQGYKLMMKLSNSQVKLKT